MSSRIKERVEKARKRAESVEAAGETSTTGGTPKWTTEWERKKLGKRLLAIFLAQGIPSDQAIELTKFHPDLTQVATGRQPQHRTVVKWYRECTFSEEFPEDADIETMRASLKRRIQASIKRWEAQRASFAESLHVGMSLEEQAHVNAEMASAERLMNEHLKMLIRVTHVEKVPPLERLDEAEVRAQLLQHVTASIRSFGVEELDEWIQRLTEARVRASTVFEAGDDDEPSDELEDLGIS